MAMAPSGATTLLHEQTLFVTEHLQPLKKILLLIINMLCMYLLASLCHDKKLINIYNYNLLLSLVLFGKTKLVPPRNKYFLDLTTLNT